MSQGLKITSDTSDAIKSKILAYLDGAFCGTFRMACRTVGVSPSTAYKWRKEDAVFDAAVKFKRQLSGELALDFAEHKLMELIKQGDFRSIIYFLDAKGRARGYGRHRAVSVRVGNENLTTPPRYEVVFCGVFDKPTPDANY